MTTPRTPRPHGDPMLPPTEVAPIATGERTPLPADASAPSRGPGHLPPLDTSYDRDRHRRKAPMAWLPIALVLALVALLGLMLLAGALAGGEDGAGDPRDASTGGSARGGDAGTLTVGRTDVLQDAGTLGRIGALSGSTAEGRAVRVQQVVSDEGFWVGSSATRRAFVYLTPKARGAGESPFQVRAGQRVDLNGTVADLRGGDAERFGVTDAEGGSLLEKQGAYVAATRIRLSS